MTTHHLRPVIVLQAGEGLACRSVIDRQAAQAISRLLQAAETHQSGATIKSLTLAPHIQNKKAVYAVTCETLRCELRVMRTQMPYSIVIVKTPVLFMSSVLSVYALAQSFHINMMHTQTCRGSRSRQASNTVREWPGNVRLACRNGCGCPWFCVFTLTHTCFT